MAVALANAVARQGHQTQTGGNAQLVCFRLAGEEYAVPIAKVQEIILLGEITRMPQTPKFIRGLINLRSTIIPVMDLRLRLGLSAEEPTDETRIMVVTVSGKMLGIIVDAVTEVLRISREQVALSPPAAAGLGGEHLAGLVTLDHRRLLLLDLDNLLSNHETATI